MAEPIRYLEDEVLASAVGDVVEVARYHARHHCRDNGHFSTPRQVFCYADHLGYLTFGGSDSTARSVKFIKRFFPPTYKPFAELLVAMWRHGTVHQIKPYSYRAPLADGDAVEVVVRWLSTNHNRKRERAQHLLVFPMERKTGTVYLVMNSCQLADDLVTAINGLIDALRSGEVDFSTCASRVSALDEPRSYRDAGKSMADSVMRQIRRAWEQQGGMLDASGAVITRHPDSDCP
jgi:hypothetical protein